MHHMADDTIYDDLIDRVRTALGHNVSILRERSALSLRAAARGAKIHHTEWLRIERGEIDPRVSTLLRMQNSLNVDSLETLLGATPSRGLLGSPPSAEK